MNLPYFMFWGCYLKLYDLFFPFYKRRLTVLIHGKNMLNTDLVNDTTNVKICEQVCHKLVIMAIDIDHIAKFSCAKLLQYVSLPHLSGTEKYQRFSVSIAFPLQKLFVNCSFHVLYISNSPQNYNFMREYSKKITIL